MRQGSYVARRKEFALGKGGRDGEGVEGVRVLGCEGGG